MMTFRRAGVLAPPAFLLVLVCAAAVAQPEPAFDHLQCFRIKDALARGLATADLVPQQSPPFVTQHGCKIKLPARHYCTAVSKQSLEPPPTHPVAGPDVHEFLCYDVRCERGVDPGSAITVEDQFGSRTVTLSRARGRRLCVPAVRPQLTPTPPTPTAPTPTPTIGADPPCFWDGQQCQGSCSMGPCVYDGAQNKCVCPAAFDLACDQFALGACAGHLCFAPGQVCVPGSQPTVGLGCHCVVPTPIPSP
jgi:hypothetical protein